MKIITLIFPSYLHLSGFVSVADNANIEMDLRNKSLTANFSEKEVSFAVNSFDAQVLMNPKQFKFTAS